MWFKKKSVLQSENHYNSNTAVDGTDWLTNLNGNGWSVSQILPSAADAGNYFYLPALGVYLSGQLEGVGGEGYYWSSSARPGDNFYAYYLGFNSSSAYVNSYPRYAGFRVEPTLE